MEDYRLGITCQYCGTETEEREELHGTVMACPKCDAYVSLNDQGKPNGTLLTNHGRRMRRSIMNYESKLVSLKTAKGDVTEKEARRSLWEYANKMLEFKPPRKTLNNFIHNELVAMNSLYENTYNKYK